MLADCPTLKTIIGNPSATRAVHSALGRSGSQRHSKEVREIIAALTAGEGMEVSADVEDDARGDGHDSDDDSSDDTPVDDESPDHGSDDSDFW
jgi:hypothetical protein